MLCNIALSFYYARQRDERKGDDSSAGFWIRCRLRFLLQCRGTVAGCGFCRRFRGPGAATPDAAGRMLAAVSVAMVAAQAKSHRRNSYFLASWASRAKWHPISRKCSRTKDSIGLLCLLSRQFGCSGTIQAYFRPQIAPEARLRLKIAGLLVRKGHPTGDQAGGNHESCSNRQESGQEN